jgi:hypothetical protein
MNERIKELAEQATSTLSVNHEGYRGKGYIEQVEYFDKVKFAELIVRECCQALSPMLRDMISRGQGVELIKQQFGLE